VKDALGIPIARVRASGHLAPHADWPWPYLVFDFIPGDSLGEQWAQVSSADRMRIARELGQAVRRLHAISTAGSPVFCPTTQDYQTLLVNQRAGCADRHRAWGHLPAHLIDQIDRYLPPIETLLEDQTPHLIHADLTRDHLLGRVTDGAWRTLAIIDFGDAMTGSLLYELGALHLDLFQADRAMLSAFLSAYGLPAAAYPALPARALATALLHRFDLFAGLPPAALDVPSLEDLAQALWRAGGY
jgi:hygromycin-B 7''-O-kinase